MVVGGKREPGGRELHSALPSGPDAFVKLALCLLWIGRLDFRSELSLYPSGLHGYCTESD